MNERSLDITSKIQIPVSSVPEIVAFYNQEIPKRAVRAMYRAMGVAGNIAATKYMVRNSTAGGVYLKGQGAVDPSRLTWRSGRLARSLSGQETQGQTGMTPEGIRNVVQQGSKTVGQFGSAVPYAARHEWGGTFPITARQRGFFYAKWKETRDSMWRALFVKGLKGGSITTPPRPFLMPTINDPQAQESMWAQFTDEFTEMRDEALKKFSKS